MAKWIILLRGINVSGQKKIIMSEFKGHVESLGYNNVQTYIQSGNLVIDTDDVLSQSDIENQMTQLIQNQYGYHVDVFAIEPVTFEKLAKANPFLEIPDIDTKQLSLTILREVPEPDNIKRLKDFKTAPDEYVIQGAAMYIRYVNGAGKSKLTNSLIEAKLKVKATSRNWNTTLKLIGLSLNS